jgi:hypothetical protein
MNITDIHYRHWTVEDRLALKLAGTSLPDMLKVALDVTARMPSGIHIVSGPITTGGVGTIKNNLFVFKRIIEHLAKNEKLNIFSQMPFEDGMVAYHQEWKRTARNGDYCWPILIEFYEPLFAARKFEKFHFIHGFESSIGACWERDQCATRGFGRRILPRELSVSLLTG